MRPCCQPPRHADFGQQRIATEKSPQCCIRSASEQAAHTGTDYAYSTIKSALIRARSVVQVHPGPPFKSVGGSRFFFMRDQRTDRLGPQDDWQGANEITPGRSVVHLSLIARQEHSSFRHAAPSPSHTHAATSSSLPDRSGFVRFLCPDAAPD
jgi:hypothetical protein